MNTIERLKRIEIASRQIVRVSMQAPTRDGIVICAKTILHDAEALIAELSPPLQSAIDEGFDGSPHQRAGYPRPSECGKLVEEYFDDERNKQHQSPVAPEHGGAGWDEAFDGGRR